MPPSKFFTKCYSVRSRLVHGSEDFPPWHLVNEYGGALEMFVRDLLTGELLELLHELERGDSGSPSEQRTS